MLAKFGVRQARIEIGWGQLNWDDETKIVNPKIKECLLACRKYGVRPLVLLNAHHGVPVPFRYFSSTLAAPAHKGDTKVQLTDTSGLIPGYSGFCNLTDYWACEAFVTEIDGKTVTLSKPLPTDLGSDGKSVLMATLKYRPFSQPGSDDYKATIAGWQRYTGNVARYVADVLGTHGSADEGFDMEIWNELTFGSNFLSIGNYYSPNPYTYNADSIWGNLVKATADYADAHPSDFRGVRFCDGFSNTTPWPASSLEPKRVTALSHHPYAGRKTYPADEYKGDSMDALFQVDKSGYKPSYTQAFPEYFMTGLQTETSARDAGPITTEIYGVKHGRNARMINDKVVPCPLWITEVGMAPNEIGVNDTEASLRLKAKTTARYYCFYINKGVERIYLYAACAGDHWLGIVPDSFVKFARSGAAYPADDSAYVSPSLRTLGRIVAKMRDGLDPGLKSVRQIRLDSVTDRHDHYQFAGDGTPAHPSLYDRDAFAFLPFQVNSTRFVIPYYVMTRDVTKEFIPEVFTIRISGIKGTNASISAYDPINDHKVFSRIDHRSKDSLDLTLQTADYPYLLEVSVSDR
jgi:hypothetical protein